MGIENVDVLDVTSHGVSIVESLGVFLTKVDVSGVGGSLDTNRVTAAGLDGILVLETATGGFVSGNRITASDDNGIDTRGTGFLFIDNTVRKNGANDIETAGDALFFDNDFDTANL